MTEKNSEYILSSLSNRSILVWDMGFIDEHISYFEKIISSLQERGYVFLTLSSMQQ